MPKTMGMLGKKVGMTRLYNEMGFVVPVTVVEAGPCVVLQIKTVKNDGYNSVQVGFVDKKPSRVNKPESGHFGKSNTQGLCNIKEFRVESPEDYEIGQAITLSELFKVGDVVDVQGVSKGRGFQGVVKRYGFAGGCASHGSGFLRAPGSIGCSAYPGKVIKGKKMPGRMGNDTVLRKNVKIIDIREDENVIILKGPLPGAKQGLLKIYTK